MNYTQRIKIDDKMGIYFLKWGLEGVWPWAIVYVAYK